MREGKTGIRGLFWSKNKEEKGGIYILAAKIWLRL